MTGAAVVRSGWTPAGLVVALTGVLLWRVADVAAVDVARFAVYVAGWIVLPGTLVWRGVTARRGDRPLAEDLAIGALVGSVVELPVYLACVAAGVPQAYLAWPLLVAAATLATSRGRRLWRRTGQRMSLRWSWASSLLMAAVVVWFARNVWGPTPATGPTLLRPYVDENYHLSLAAGLRHDFPSGLLHVADTDLRYHWLSHLHVAASSWATGIEAAVLLRSLVLPTVFLLTVLAAAHVAVRLTGAGWTGVVLLAALVVRPASFVGWSDDAGEALLSTRVMISPSAGFVIVSLLLVVLLCVEILRRDLTGAWPWALLVLAMLVAMGSKASTLPTVMAGLVAAAVVASVVRRRPDGVAIGLAVTCVVAFVVGTWFFFGFGGSQGLVVDPFGATSEGSTLSRPLAIVAAVGYLGYLSTALGLVGLVVRRGYARADLVFVVITGLAGIGAGLFFRGQSSSEYYFVYGALLPLLLGGVLGLHRLAARLPSRLALRVGVIGSGVAVLLAFVLMAVDRPLERAAMTGSAARQVLTYYAVPMLVVVLLFGLALLVVLLAVRGRHDRSTRGAVVGVASVAIAAGLGAAPGLVGLASVQQRFGDPSTYVQRIGSGGIETARWLREHSDTDDVVATNAHCEPSTSDVCFARVFWMAAYSERQLVVEGWSYVAWSIVGLTSPEPGNTVSGPFWDPERLALNDAAFERPGADTIGALRERYDVRWMVVDLRTPGTDVEALRAAADVRHEDGDYLVLEVR